MKKIITAILTGVTALLLINGLDAWYQSVPWYMTNEQIYMLITACITVANLLVSTVVNSIKFKKKEQEVKVNWLTVDPED